MSIKKYKKRTGKPELWATKCLQALPIFQIHSKTIKATTENENSTWTFQAYTYTAQQNIHDIVVWQEVGEKNEVCGKMFFKEK